MFAAALTVICVAFIDVPAAASASAYGCTTSGAGLPWYGLNSAYTCIEVDGTGNTVWHTQLEWTGIGTACNYQFQLRWSENKGKVYETQTSSLHTGCTAAHAKHEWNYGRENAEGLYEGVYKKSGKLCGYVLEAGTARGGVPCEYIN
jgi:hypothetical protein